MFVTAPETFLMRRAALLFLSTSSFRSFLYEIASPVWLPATNVVFIIHLSWLQNKRASRHVTTIAWMRHPHAELLLLHFSSIKNYFKEHSRTQPDSKPFFLLCNAPLYLSFYQKSEESAPAGYAICKETLFAFVISRKECGSFLLLFAKMHHPQQLLRHLQAFQTHDIILYIIPW